MRKAPKTDSLDNQAVDYALTAARSVVGPLPIVGPLLSELVGVTVRNQRLDRIAKFAGELERRLQKLESSAQIAEQLRDDSFTEILEEGIRQASRSLNDDRRRYIASLVCGSLSPATIQLADSRRLLRILGEMSDIEIIWLRSYRRPTSSGDEDFIQRHIKILRRPLVPDGAPQEEVDKLALHDSYQEHLVQLNLLEARYAVDRQTNLPEFDSSGKPRVLSYTITRLGSLLLRVIGLGDSE